MNSPIDPGDTSRRTGVENAEPPATSTVLASATLPPTPESAGVARRLLRDQMVGLLARDSIDDLLLLVTELVSNAAAATVAPFELRVSSNNADTLLVELTDSSPGVPRLRNRDLYAEEGRGLWLIDQLAAAWGAVRKPPGKIMWFTLPL